MLYLLRERGGGVDFAHGTPVSVPEARDDPVAIESPDLPAGGDPRGLRGAAAREDLHNTLSTGPDHQGWWENELHPTEPGFHRIADKFATVFQGLP